MVEALVLQNMSSSDTSSLVDKDSLALQEIPAHAQLSQSYPPVKNKMKSSAGSSSSSSGGAEVRAVLEHEPGSEEASRYPSATLSTSVRSTSDVAPNLHSRYRETNVLTPMKRKPNTPKIASDDVHPKRYRDSVTPAYLESSYLHQVEVHKEDDHITESSDIIPPPIPFHSDQFPPIHGLPAHLASSKPTPSHSSSSSDTESSSAPAKARSLRKTKSRGKGKGNVRVPLDELDEFDNYGYCSSDSEPEKSKDKHGHKKQCWK